MLWIVLSSLSARRAWIEMSQSTGIITQSAVALRKESVDRNCMGRQDYQWKHVALRKESVDRNFFSAAITQFQVIQSLSARRAWIEIAPSKAMKSFCSVALRKESVDRNLNTGSLTGEAAVALRKESVDRNRELPSRL